MKKILLILIISTLNLWAATPLTVGNIPVVFSSTALSNGPMSVVNGTNVNNQGALLGYSLTATNDLNFGATLNGINSNVVQRISGLTSDAQTQITANGTAITLLNLSVTSLTNGLLSVSNSLGTTIINLNSISNGLITTSNSLGTAIINLNSISNGLITTSNRVETVNTAKQNVFTTGTGITNSANVLSNNIVAGANITFTTGANGAITIAATSSGSGAPVGTVINTASTTAGQLAQFSDNQKTNITPVTIGLGLTNNGSVISNNIVAGNNITITAGANGQLSLSATTNALIIGLGLTNNGGTLSNNIIAGSNVTITAGANGQLSIASTGGGSQTPWTSDINGGGFNLTNIALIQATNSTTTNGMSFTNGVLTVVKGGIGVTATDGLLLTNNQIAASGAQQQSPSVHLGGQGWKTTATAGSQPVDFQMYVLPVQGTTTPTATFTLSSSINGGAYANALTYTSAGVFTSSSSIASGGSVTASANSFFSQSGRSKLGSSADGFSELLNNGGTAPSAFRYGRFNATKTSNYTVTALDSGTLFDNIGAVGAVTNTLPTAARGLFYEFYVDAAQTVTIVAGASTTIRYGATVTSAAGNVTSNTQGSIIRICAISTTQWIVEFLNETLASVTGPWTFN